MCGKRERAGVRDWSARHLAQQQPADTFVAPPPRHHGCVCSSGTCAPTSLQLLAGRPATSGLPKRTCKLLGRAGAPDGAGLDTQARQHQIHGCRLGEGEEGVANGAAKHVAANLLMSLPWGSTANSTAAACSKIRGISNS